MSACRTNDNTVVTGIEMFRKYMDLAAGDNVGLLLRGVERDDVQRGQVIANPVPSILIPSLWSVYVLTMEEGGRHKPFLMDIALSSTSVQQT